MEGFCVSSLMKGIVWRLKYEWMNIRSFVRNWNVEKKKLVLMRVRVFRRMYGMVLSIL